MSRHEDRVPAEPFTRWVNEQLAAVREEFALDDSGEATILAGRLGTTVRALYRFKHQLDGSSQPTEHYSRNRVTDMLEHAGLFIWDVYPDLADDVEVEPDIFCPRCRVDVTPIEGRCSWCRSLPGKRPRGLTRSRCPHNLTDEQLTILHRVHHAGPVPVLDLAKRIWKRAGYSSYSSAHDAIRRGWRRLGLEQIPRGDLMRVVNDRIEREPVLPPDKMEQAVSWHRDYGVSVEQIAKRLLPHARVTYQGTLGNALRAEFKARGIYSKRRASIDVVDRAA